MPPLSTHFNFAKIFFNNYEADYNKYLYLLGVLAPDTFRIDSEFYQYHFWSDDIDPDYFRQVTENSGLNRLQCSFREGYFAHLWLDKYIRRDGLEFIYNHIKKLDYYCNREIVSDQMRYYDLQEINQFLIDIEKKGSINYIDQIKGLNYIYLPEIINRFRVVMDTFKINKRSEERKIIFSKEAYHQFLTGILLKYVKELEKNDYQKSYQF